MTTFQMSILVFLSISTALGVALGLVVVVFAMTMYQFGCEEGKRKAEKQSCQN